MVSRSELKLPVVLVVEDDHTIGSALESALLTAGYSVHWERQGYAAIARARVTQPDLVLLDVGLPDIDGLTVCRELRMMAASTVIVLLTARAEQIDIISGLESGADDYLTKPFSVSELLARVRAHLRRAGNETATPQLTTDFGALSIDVGARRVTVGDSEVPLTAREFDLLVRLAREPGVAVSRDVLMADVWDSNWFGSTKTLDVHVASVRRQLREALERGPSGSELMIPDITTLRGHGYRLDVSRPLP